MFSSQLSNSTVTLNLSHHFARRRKKQVLLDCIWDLCNSNKTKILPFCLIKVTTFMELLILVNY